MKNIKKNTWKGVCWLGGRIELKVRAILLSLYVGKLRDEEKTSFCLILKKKGLLKQL